MLQQLWNPAVQISADGMLTDAFLTRLHAVRAKHKVAIWQIAQAAKFSPAYLGNVTRFWGDSPGKKLNVSTGFANRLAAVIEALERAKSDDDVREALNPGEAAPDEAAAAAPSTHRAEEGGGQSTDDFVAIMRRRGIISISITLEPLARAEEGGGQSTDDFVAIMRRRGIISISITLEPLAKAV